MKKCLRCGHINKDDALECEKCQFSFKEQAVLEELKKYTTKEDPIVAEKNKSSLIDNPVLTFIFGILSIMLPFFLFSFLTWYMKKKPSKTKLIPFRNIGNVFAYIGFVLSIIIVGYFIWNLIF